jgi:prepilin-type N-terminal cleavage/methylation domain-containing protein
MKKAFSLIELSITVMVIGILIAFVSGGRVLINNSLIHKQITQFLEFKRATQTFETTYDAIPGDFGQATSYFTGDNIVDGNQNGFINGADGARRYDDRGVSGEKIHLFRHLSLAGLLREDYKANNLEKGVDIPVTILNSQGGILSASYLRPNVFGTDANRGTYTTSEIGGMHIYLVIAFDLDGSRPAGTSANKLSAGTDKRIFNGKDLYAIDLKIDDGLPATGDLMAFKTGCTDDDYIEYNLNNDIDQCYAMYRLKNLRP